MRHARPRAFTISVFLAYARPPRLACRVSVPILVPALPGLRPRGARFARLAPSCRVRLPRSVRLPLLRPGGLVRARSALLVAALLSAVRPASPYGGAPRSPAFFRAFLAHGVLARCAPAGVAALSPLRAFAPLLMALFPRFVSALLAPARLRALFYRPAPMRAPRCGVPSRVPCPGRVPPGGALRSSFGSLSRAPLCILARSLACGYSCIGRVFGLCLVSTAAR